MKKSEMEEIKKARNYSIGSGGASLLSAKENTLVDQIIHLEDLIAELVTLSEGFASLAGCGSMGQPAVSIQARMYEPEEKVTLTKAEPLPDNLRIVRVWTLTQSNGTENIFLTEESATAGRESRTGSQVKPATALTNGVSYYLLNEPRLLR